MRSYGIPGEDTRIYLEIKKKYKGVVYKRRIGPTLAQARSYLVDDIKPADQGQIFNEIDFMLRRYRLKPALYLAYDRRAWIGIEAPQEPMSYRATLLIPVLWWMQRMNRSDWSLTE